MTEEVYRLWRCLAKHCGVIGLPNCFRIHIVIITTPHHGAGNGLALPTFDNTAIDRGSDTTGGAEYLAETHKRVCM